MTTYVCGSSVAIRGLCEDFDGTTYGRILDAVFTSSFHHYFFTILGALWETRNLVLKDEDFIVFNLGHNDCIYRKDKKVQSRLLRDIYEHVSEDKVSCDFYLNKIKIFETKKDNELIQLLTFDEFAEHLDVLFSRFPKKGIVLSISWFERTNPNIGWGYDEVVRTNEIMREKALKYGMVYVDLFKPPSITTDGTHFSQKGQSYVASLIGEIERKKKEELGIKEKEYRISIGTMFCNESHSIDKYSEGIVNLDYPKELIDLYWIENNSSDGTWGLLQKKYEEIKSKYNYHSFKLEQKPASYGPLPKEVFGAHRDGKVDASKMKDINWDSWRLAFNVQLISLYNSILEEAVKNKSDFSLTVCADLVVPPNLLRTWIKNMEDIPDCGWIGGVLHGRYPNERILSCRAHYLHDSQNPMWYGLVTPIMKVWNDTPIPPNFPREFVNYRPNDVKEFNCNGLMTPWDWDWGYRGTTESEILQLQKEGKGIFEVAAAGHCKLVRKIILDKGIRMKICIESDFGFNEDMRKIGYKMYCNSYVYLEHISTDGKIYRHSLSMEFSEEEKILQERKDSFLWHEKYDIPFPFASGLYTKMYHYPPDAKQARPRPRSSK